MAGSGSVANSILRLRSGQVLQQNAQAYVSRRALKSEMAADIRAVFNARNRQEAEELLAFTVQKYNRAASGLSDWMEESIPEGLTIFSFQEKHRRRLRMTNGLERLNREIRHPIKVAAMIHNTASCLRLVTAIVMEISEEWQTGRIYIRPDDDDYCQCLGITWKLLLQKECCFVQIRSIH